MIKTCAAVVFLLLGIGVRAGEVPVPYTVELAPGEVYRLTGTFVNREDMYQLKVNLKNHPWLANERRKENPYYPLIMSFAPPVEYLGRMVSVKALATSVIEEDALGRLVHRIELELLEKPELMSHYKNDRGWDLDPCSCEKQKKRTRK